MVALVAVAGSVVAGGLLLASRDGIPSTKPSGTPSGLPSVEPTPHKFRYVALGDSFTAAPGVPDLVGESICGRSSHNYPHLIVQQLRSAFGKAELVDRSCNGADTTHLTSGQYPPRVEPQLDAVTADTDLVTISLGANDFGLFRGLLMGCARLRASDPSGAPCSELTGEYSANSLSASIRQVGDSLQTAIAEVVTRSPDAKVLLVGYPAITPASGTCTDRLPLADGDVAYVNRQFEELFTTMRHAARKAGATYVDVFAASEGHDICSDDPWVNDVYTDPGRAQFYHPFVEEQAAVARLILAELA
jgi:lysophospholipase L1-like esterase